MKKYLYMAAAVLMTAVLGMTACAKKDVPSDTQPESTVETETEASTAQTGETKETDSEKTRQYHMLQGTIIKMEEDGSAFTLQADDGKDYEISLQDIGDVEVELAEDVHIAIACIGEPSGDLEDVTLVVALPEQEEWTIYTDEGTTTSNAMSSFSMKTEDGRELSFLKDNCPIEEGALEGDSGDEIIVTYVNAQGTNFPIEIMGK